jgi:biopolymer transport protein ExbD
VAVTSDRRLYLNGIPLQESDLRNQIQTLMETRKEKIVLIKGDEDAPYSAIMNAMDRLREANIENIGLITERKIRQAGTGGQ